MSVHGGKALSTTSSLGRRSTNPRFANVTARIDSGPNMRKIMEKYEGTSGPNARPKLNNKFFQTIKPLTLEKLLEPELDGSESIYKYDLDEVSAMQSVGGASVAHSIVSHSAQAEGPGPSGAVAGQPESNLIIFDCRSFDEYTHSHVHGARHYDRTMLHKSTNQFPRELYFFRGPRDGDKMVLLYDEDGKGLEEVANAFVEKGFENTYVLAGGYLGAAVRCPRILSNPPPLALSQHALDQHMGSMRLTGASPSGRLNTAGSTRTQETSLSGFGAGRTQPGKWK